MSERKCKKCGCDIFIRDGDWLRCANCGATFFDLNSHEEMKLTMQVEQLEQKPDISVVDPPRDGIHPKAIGKIIAFGAPRIIYVSCKPSSLARDLAIFQGNGYQVERLGMLNQFCHTEHIETVALLTKKENV